MSEELIERLRGNPFKVLGGDYIDAADAIESLTAERDRLAAELAALRAQEPVSAEHRFRHPQKTMPDWSIWQQCNISNRPSWDINAQGYEVEYRALYAAPVPAAVPSTTEETIRTATQYAHNLVVSLHRDHYQDNNSFEPFDDLLGLLSQIDNMIYGWKEPAQVPDDATCEALIESSDMRWNGDHYYGDGGDLMDLVRAAMLAAIAKGGE